MNQPLTIIVASVYKPLLTLLERAMQGTGAIIQQVVPVSEVLLKAVGERQKALVVLHERKGQTEWLDLAKTLHKTGQGTRTIAFGESTDVGAVARGIVHGLTNYVPIGHGTDLVEVRRLLTDAVAGEQAAADSIYGRVKAMLPSVKDGTFLSHSGKVVSSEDAIQQCVSLGLTAEETAGYLGVSANDANKIAGKARRRPRVGLGMPSDLGLLRRLAVGTLIAGLAVFAFNALRRPSFPYELAPLTGTVTLDGKPVAQGLVRLTPDRSHNTKGPTGTGLTDARGQFRITTVGHVGAIVGHHRVTVVPAQLPAEGTAQSTASHIPERYWKAHTSGLECEVNSDSPNKMDIVLLPGTAQRK